MNEPELRALIPETKHSLDKAQKLVDLGYPAVAPVLREIFEWVQDINWPVAKIFAPFLANIGQHCHEHIEFVLMSDDSMWKYWVLEEIVAKMEPDDRRALRPLLLRAQEHLSEADLRDEVGLAMAEVLQGIL